MEFNLSILTVFATILSVIILTFLLKISNKKRVIDTKLPEVKGAWPVIGNLHLLGGSKLPHKVLGDLADKYGPIFTIKLGFHKVLVVSNGEIAKECFTTNDRAFASRSKAQAFELMTYNYALFGFTPYGDYWRKIRKIVTLELLSQRRVQMFGHIHVSEVRVSIKNLYDVWVKNKECKHLDTVKVDMKQWFEDVILNVIVRILSGKTFSTNDEERARFHVVIREYFELLGAFVVSDYIPFLKYFDLDGTKKSMKKVAKEVGGIMDEWLYELKIKRESGEQYDGNQVFINALDSTLQKASEDELSGFDHDTIIKATCQQVLTAALDTTSTTLTWALSLLLNNPKTLEIAQREIDEHVGKERLIDESDLKNLVYLESIIKETMRLYPAAPLSVCHESMEDCIVGGYSIPKGTRLIVNLSKIHYDPDIWSDPYEFQPERFLTSRHKDIDFKGKHFELIPFGSGRRMCPGVYLAVQELRFTLASLLQQFVLKKVSEEEPIDMNECGGLTVGKETPLEVLLAPRLSTNMYDVTK